VLARNIIKLVVERRRALPFARFRFKLVAVLLGMTLIPAVLVLLVGSELIRNSVDRWFNAPMDEVLSSANGSPATTTRSSSARLGAGRSGLRGLPAVDLSAEPATYAIWSRRTSCRSASTRRGLSRARPTRHRRRSVDRRRAVDSAQYSRARPIAWPSASPRRRRSARRRAAAAAAS
jgi:nitrogen fixation/metabolism regulation signal transduction histidine kinase